VAETSFFTKQTTFIVLLEMFGACTVKVQSTKHL